jgi:hypothetical protein
MIPLVELPKQPKRLPVARDGKAIFSALARNVRSSATSRPAFQRAKHSRLARSLALGSDRKAATPAKVLSLSAQETPRTPTAAIALTL